MGKMVVNFSLDSKGDRDLVRWLEGLPKRKRSEAIRDTLRAGLGRGGVTLGDVYGAVKELERKIEAGAVVITGGASPTSENWDEPPEAAAALAALANL